MSLTKSLRLAGHGPFSSKTTILGLRKWPNTMMLRQCLTVWLASWTWVPKVNMPTCLMMMVRFFWNSLGLDDGIGNENPFHRGCQIQNHQQPFGRYLNNWENSPSALYFLPILQFVGGFSTMPLLNPHIRWKYTSPLVFNEFNVPILIGSNIANLASFNEQF